MRQSNKKFDEANKEDGEADADAKSQQSKQPAADEGNDA